ncbi:hypothetical protein FS749_014048, partial [Ceratobasidium sp. UAMH 11750]
KHTCHQIKSLPLTARGLRLPTPAPAPAPARARFSVPPSTVFNLAGLAVTIAS